LQQSVFEQKVWSECKNGEGEWGETLKNMTVHHAYIKFVQNYPFFQQWEILIGLILTQPVIKFHSHHQKDIDANSVSRYLTDFLDPLAKFSLTISRTYNISQTHG